MSLYYDINSIDEELVDTSFKYTILSSDDDQIYTEYLSGNFSAAKSNSRYMLLDEQEVVVDLSEYYRVYLWIDSTDGDQSLMQGKVFKAELRADYTSLDSSVTEITTFSYTGGYQTFVVPVSGYYKVETWGAQGGAYSTFIPGNGAYAHGYIYMNEGETYYVYVGGAGSLSNKSSGTLAGGYNGGGAGGKAATFYGGGGGHYRDSSQMSGGKGVVIRNKR